MRISPRAYRVITLIAAISLGIIVVTGAAVRLTGSGLGCPEWPNCSPGRLTPHDATDVHAMTEFLNRTFTGVVSVAVMLAVLGSFLRRPRRADLTWWSLGLVAGVLGQIVLGGLTVLFHLKPPFVMGHFLLSMVLIANAVVLYVRAGEPDGATRVRAPGDVRRIGALLLAVAAVVVFTGTIVTAAGPHGGDERVERLGVPIEQAARVHGIFVVALIATTIAAYVLSKRAGADSTRRAAVVLLAVTLPQAAVGYVQYFTGVPEILVAIHILGATLVWAASVRLFLTRSEPALDLSELTATQPEVAAAAR